MADKTPLNKNSPEKMKRLESWNKLIDSAVIALTNNDGLKYFGCLLYGIRKFMIDQDEALNQFPGMTKAPLGWTDGESIHILMDDSMKLSKLLFVMVHELMHILTKTMERKGDRPMILWNLATDHCINAMIKKMIETDKDGSTKYMKYYDDCFMIDELYNNDPDLKLSAETVYEYIKKEYDSGKMKIEIVGISGYPGNSGQGDGDGDESDDGNSGNSKNGKGKDSKSNDPGNSPGGKIIIKVKYKGKEYYGTDTDIENDPSLSREQKDAIKQKMKELTDDLRDKASSIWNCDETMRGNMHGSVCDFFNKLYEIKVPWEKIFENALKYQSQNFTDQTWSWPNEVYRGLGLHLPGMLRGEKSSAIVCCIDTSGSISDESLDKFISVLKKAPDLYETIIVMFHDTIVDKMVVVEDFDTFEKLVHELRQIGGVSRGGTSHDDAFSKIQQIYDTEDYKISTIIFMTDYYSDVEHVYSKYDFIRNFTTIWLLQHSNMKTVDLGGCETITIKIEDLECA